MSRAVVVKSLGGPEVLEVEEVPEPHAGPGQLRVRVTAAGLNPMDWLIVADEGLAAAFGVRPPTGFGFDFAGVVDEGRLTVPIAARYPIERIREAVTLQASRHVRGKVVIVL